jgi:hypothetical protein
MLALTIFAILFSSISPHFSKKRAQITPATLGVIPFRIAQGKVAERRKIQSPKSSGYPTEP